MSSAVSAKRPTVSVYDIKGKAKSRCELPPVFWAPIRTDVVHQTFKDMNKNRQQPHAVNRWAGMQTAAESWGTGRAVARIPRVPGGGTSRSGQGAFGNMCRGGRMFAPLHTWRRFHRRINLKQKRFAVCSALAASAVPALVMARGHTISQTPEIPLVVKDAAIVNPKKTKNAVTFLKKFGAYTDFVRARTRKIRAGSGKARNRRYVHKRGPLIVYKDQNSLTNAFRNLRGVQTAHVDSLSLLDLAPGGHLGRFIIWTEGAFRRLHELFGSKATARPKNVNLPANAVVASADIARIANSHEIQSTLRPKRCARFKANPVFRKRNPFHNSALMVKLNPAVKGLIRARATKAANKQKAKAAGKKPLEVRLTRTERMIKEKKTMRRNRTKAWFRDLTSNF